jgi:hypothetical protein
MERIIGNQMVACQDGVLASAFACVSVTFSANNEIGFLEAKVGKT